jgi:hypothetical protein
MYMDIEMQVVIMRSITSKFDPAWAEMAGVEMAGVLLHCFFSLIVLVLE